MLMAFTCAVSCLKQCLLILVHLFTLYMRHLFSIEPMCGVFFDVSRQTDGFDMVYDVITAQQFRHKI